VVGEEEIIEIYLSGLISVDEISKSAIDGVKGEACEVHGYEIEVHSLNTE